MRASIILAGALLSAACSASEDQAKPVTSDAQAIAEVERLGTPPVLPVQPQPITFSDLEKYGLFGAGCYFLDGNGAKASMLFIASDEKGWMILESKLVELSADRSSAEMPYLSWSRYVGLAQTVVLQRDQAKARSTGPETESAPGEITIRDENDRVVFTRKGLIDCGA